jgi:hypothetical protein
MPFRSDTQFGLNFQGVFVQNGAVKRTHTQPIRNHTGCEIAGEKDVEDVFESLIAGPYSSEVRDTLTKAAPHLEELQRRYPRISPLYLAYLLREQTLVAMSFPTPQHRRQAQCWTTLLKALDEFFTASFDRPRLADFLLYMALAPQEGEEKKHLEDFWTADLWGGDLVGILRSLEKRFHLPPVEMVFSGRQGGRPTAWWSDVIALAMKEHFVETTGSPRWKAISALLSCAPAIQFCSEKTDNKTTLLSMQPDKIRQRLVRWQRPEKLELGPIGQKQKCRGYTAPDIELAADQLKQSYLQQFFPEFLLVIPS